jgi:hypothetical protein
MQICGSFDQKVSEEKCEKLTDDERQLVAKAHLAFRPGELNRQRICQRGNQYIEDDQTAQWPKENFKRTINDLQNIHIKLKNV